MFQRIEAPDLVSWNTIIAGFSGIGDGWSAVQAFVQLKAVSCEQLASDEYTLASVVSAAAALPAMCSGKLLHADIIKTGLRAVSLLRIH